MSAVAAALLLQMAALAATTPAEIQAAVDKSAILPPGTSMNVRVAGGQAVIATYQNAKANDKDCKIDAVMIAKTAMDLDSQIGRVTVYFYNRADMTRYKEVTLSAGDIKAFGSGQMDKDAFLNSVALNEKAVEDVAKISNYIEAAEARRERPVQVDFQNGKVEVNTQIESWVSDRDVRFEALRLAEKALDASPQGMVKSIHIAFADPGSQAPTREITFAPDTVRSLGEKLNDALTPITVTQVARQSTVNIVAGVGALQERRQKTLDRIKALQKDGVNVKAFMDIYVPIEQQAPLNDAARIEPDLKRLESALDDMEATRKALKDKAKPAATASNGPKAPIVGEAGLDRRSFGFVLLEDSKILSEPDQYALELKRFVPGGQAEASHDYWKAMRYFAQLLREQGKIPEAERYDRIVYDMARKNPAVTGSGSRKGKPPGAQ